MVPLTRIGELAKQKENNKRKQQKKQKKCKEHRCKYILVIEKNGGWGLGVENLIKINMSRKISEPNIFLEFSSIFFL